MDQKKKKKEKIGKKIIETIFPFMVKILLKIRQIKNKIQQMLINKK